MNKTPIIISTNFQLTESQNFLRYSKTQNRLLKISFSLYCVAIAPSLLFLSLLSLMPILQSFIESSPLLLLFIFTGMSIIGYILGYSKIICRKMPVNYICLILFEAGLSYMFLGIDVFLAHNTFIVFVIILFILGMSNLFYVISLKDYYSGLVAFLISLGPNIMVFAFFGFWFSEKYLLNVCTYFVFGVIISFLVCLGVEKLMKNEDYNLLKDDYVLVALKLLTVFPLIPHLINEEHTGEDQ